jgi:MFS family permease
LAFVAVSLGKILSAPIFGYLSDRYAHNKILIYGLFLIVCCYLFNTIVVIYNKVLLLLLGRFIVGVLSGSYATAYAILSIISSSNNRLRLNYFRLSNAASLVGFTIGPGILVFFPNFTNAAPFALAFILGLFNFIIVSYTLGISQSKNNFLSVKKGTQNSQSLKVNSNNINYFSLNFFKKKLSIFIYVFHNKRTRFIALGSICSEIGLKLYHQSLPLFVTQELMYEVDRVGGFLLVTSAVMALSTLFLQPLQKYLFLKVRDQVKATLFIIFILLCMRIYFYYVYSDYYLCIIVTFIVSVIFYAVMPLINIGFTGLFSENATDDIGKVMCGEVQISALSSLICATIIGVFYTTGYSIVLFWSAILICISYNTISYIKLSTDGK